MLREVGRLPEAKDRLRRATELRRDDASARKAYVDVLLRLAETGTAADQKELVAVFLPQLASTDEELLGRLLVMALDTFSAEAAQSLADEILKRDPDAALPSLVKAEALLSAGNADAALAAARKALSGSLAASQAARAHALVGRVVAEQAYKAYTSAGDRTSKTLVDATSARYREALASLRRAAEAGLDVARDVENVERALEALGGAQAEYRDRQVEAARAECVQLGPQARLAYDRDRPLATTAAADVTLAVSAGREPQGGRIPSGATVSLRDASWVGGACWVEVRAQDGTSGWAKQSSFR
jgi:tetratricopeptide (TPR) repeat protein